MAASVFELILARVAALLLSATAAGAHVYRGRDDALSADEIPALNIRRADTSGDVIGNSGERHILAFTVACYAKGAAWETEADALHMQVHALLMADTQLASKGRGLRCTGSEPQDDSADQRMGRITARYQMQVFVRPGDLSVAI
jgi:hypothetical protein